jgi:23S rRNA pseudouridine1911/1915/1917 synthase
MLANRILYEDNHLIAVNKQRGELIQGDQTGDIPLPEKVKQFLKDKYHKPGNVFLGVVHRLDRPASGVVVFAKTGKALSRLNKMFSSREEIKKIYWALVAQVPPAQTGTLTHFLLRNPQQNKSYASETFRPGAKPASLTYTHFVYPERYHLLEIELHTGRHHQIRAQLAKIGCPIVGDVKYGYPRPNEDACIHLHARKLEFIHPVAKNRVIIIANPPPDHDWDALRTTITA